MLSLSWLDRDGKLLLLARGIRAIGFGFVSVTLFIYLSEIGFNIFLDGLIVSVILASGTVFTFIAGVFADRWGRRKFLIFVAMLMAASGLIYALTTDMILLVVGALLGTLSPSGGDAGSFQTIEQAMLPQVCPRIKRNSVFAIYNMIGRLSGAVGALLSVVPTLVQSNFHVGLVESYKPLFVAYSCIALATAVIYAILSERVEIIPLATEVEGSKMRPALSPRSKSIIAKLSVLMGIDSFAGGFVLQSIVSYWFHARFGAPLSELSILFFTTGLLSAGAFIISGRLADRIGAINTMVFTHLPSGVLLILIPLAPTLGISLGLYLIRQPLSLMDIPARQAYVVSVVNPSERTLAAGISNVAKNSAQTISPSITGFVMQFLSLSFPFFICGFLKIAYDLTLYSSFRKIKESQVETTQ